MRKNVYAQPELEQLKVFGNEIICGSVGAGELYEDVFTTSSEDYTI